MKLEPGGNTLKIEDVVFVTWQPNDEREFVCLRY